MLHTLASHATSTEAGIPTVAVEDTLALEGKLVTRMLFATSYPNFGSWL